MASYIPIKPLCTRSLSHILSPRDTATAIPILEYGFVGNEWTSWRDRVTEQSEEIGKKPHEADLSYTAVCTGSSKNFQTVRKYGKKAKWGKRREREYPRPGRGTKGVGKFVEKTARQDREYSLRYSYLNFQPRLVSMEISPSQRSNYAEYCPYSIRTECLCTTDTYNQRSTTAQRCRAR